MPDLEGKRLHRPTHQSSQRVRGVRPPRTPRCQTCAAEQRLFPGDRKEKEMELEDRQDERERNKRRRGVLLMKRGDMEEKEGVGEKKEELFSKGAENRRED